MIDNKKSVVVSLGIISVLFLLLSLYVQGSEDELANETSLILFGGSVYSLIKMVENAK